MKRVALVCLAAFGLLAVGCKENVKSTRTFRLPEGNAANGQAAFVSLQCIRCHSVAGIDLNGTGSVAPNRCACSSA